MGCRGRSDFKKGFNLRDFFTGINKNPNSLPRMATDSCALSLALDIVSYRLHIDPRYHPLFSLKIDWLLLFISLHGDWIAL